MVGFEEKRKVECAYMRASVGIAVHEDEVLGVLIDADLASAGVIDSVSRPRSTSLVESIKDLVDALNARAERAGVDIESIGLTSPEPLENNQRPPVVSDKLNVVSVSGVKATGTYVLSRGVMSNVPHYIILKTDETGQVLYLIDTSVSLVLAMARVADSGRMVDNLSAEIRRLYDDEDVDSAKCIVTSNLIVDTLPMVEEVARALSAELITLDDETDHHHSVGAALYAASRRTSLVASSSNPIVPRYAAVWIAAAVLLAVIGVIVALLGFAEQRQQPQPQPQPGAASPHQQTYSNCVLYRTNNLEISGRQSDPDEPPTTSVSPKPPGPAQPSC